MRVLAECFVVVVALACAAGGAAGGSCAEGGVCSPGVESSSVEHARTMRVGLGGYSPVSYIELNRAEPGSALFASEHDGVTYLLTSESQRRLFESDPARYLPAYGGWCAFGCSVESRFEPDPTSFEVIDGRTHLFLRNDEVDARALWNESDAAEVRAKADRSWASSMRSRAYVGGRNVPASGIGLDGYSPVSYFTVGRAERGDPRFAVEHNGVTYHLTSSAQVAMFERDPSRYEPRCGGWCAFGMSVEDKFPVDPTRFKIVDGGLYLFLNNEAVDARTLWENGDEAALVRRASSHWKEVSGQ